MVLGVHEPQISPMLQLSDRCERRASRFLCGERQQPTVRVSSTALSSPTQCSPPLSIGQSCPPTLPAWWPQDSEFPPPPITQEDSWKKKHQESGKQSSFILGGWKEWAGAVTEGETGTHSMGICGRLVRFSPSAETEGNMGSCWGILLPPIEPF